MDSVSSSADSPVHDDKEKFPSDVRERAVPIKDEAPETFYVSRYRILGPILSKLFASGVEARGIERVPEDQRESKRSWNK